MAESSPKRNGLGSRKEPADIEGSPRCSIRRRTRWGRHRSDQLPEDIYLP